MHGTANPTLFCLLGVLTHAGNFNPESRCKGDQKIGPKAAQEKPAQTERYCSMDNYGNKVS